MKKHLNNKNEKTKTIKTKHKNTKKIKQQKTGLVLLLNSLK